MLELCTFVGVFICLCSFLYFKNTKQNVLPPGPRGVPLLGNLHQLGTAPHLKVSQWAEQFGRIYTIYFVHKPVLVVNDAKLIKQIFSLTPALSKFKTEVLTDMTKGCYGIGATDGEVWIEQRQFFLKALKQFGYGRGEKMEIGILGEVEDFSKWMETEQQKNGNVFVHKKITQSTTSLLWTLVTGEQIEGHDSEITHLLDEFMAQLQVVTQTGLMFFPALKHIAPQWSGAKDFDRILNKLHSFAENYFREHLKSRVEGNEPRDIIDAYMEKVETCQDPMSSFYGEQGWKHIFGSVMALLLGGGTTTATTINWAIFYLTVNQEAQKKLQVEIDKFIGPIRDPKVADKLSMPYTEAIIQETLRLSTIAPMGIIHELLDNVTFQGYNLPKGMLIMPNLYHVHHNKETWGDPENFRPERFLDGGEKLKEFLVAFQPGRRTCPGEPQVKDILFLFIAKLFQQYNFTTDASVKNAQEYLKANMGLVLLPEKLPVVVTKRRQ